MALASPALAQDAETEKAIEKYRAMLREDPWSNPGFLDVDRGEALWTTAAGPKNASLEQCDLGKGPGKVDGAFAELPRYFADADRVMDVETRILWCMEKLQGISAADYVKRPHPGGGQPVKELGAMATYVASKSAGRNSPPSSAIRRSARPPRSARRCSTAAPARSISPARPATPIRACASACRACPISREKKEARQGDRRMAGLSRVDHARDDDAAPAVRLLLADAHAGACRLGSDASVALIAFLTRQAEGGEIAAPGLKR